MAFLEGAKEHTDLSLAVRRKLHAAVLNLLDRGLDCLDQGDESVGDVFVFPCFGGYGEELFQKLRRYFAGEKIGDGHVLSGSEWTREIRGRCLYIWEDPTPTEISWQIRSESDIVIKRQGEEERTWNSTEKKKRKNKEHAHKKTYVKGYGFLCVFVN